MLKVAIKIMPREVILDTQGRAVEQSLRSNGFSLDQCRVGKMIELSLSSQNESDVKAYVEKMIVEGGLYNPLIEKYEIESIKNEK